MTSECSISILLMVCFVLQNDRLLYENINRGYDRYPAFAQLHRQ